MRAKVIADACEKWVLELKPGEPTYVEYEIPDESMGFGIVEGSRGALGHWIEIKDQKIANYQAVVPTTWNASPRDDNGNPGPIEQAARSENRRRQVNANVAVVGSGYWGKNLVRNFHSLGALALVCDTDEAGLAKARELAPDVPQTKELTAVLESDVPAVVIATPDHWHAVVTVSGP